MFRIIRVQAYKMEQHSYWEIIAKHLSRESTPEEEQQLKIWIQSDPEHQEIFDDLKQNWENQQRDGSKFSLERGKKLVRQKIDSEKVIALPTLQREDTAIRNRFNFAGIAASILIVACLAVGSYTFIYAPPAITYLEKANEAGKVTSLSLADGTIVWLNVASKIRYPENFTAEKREIYLEGEAFFEVQRNEQKPFIVHTGQVSTHVLGTSFNINAYHDYDAIEVTVASGKVSVRDSTGVIGELIANHQITYSKISGKSTRNVVEAGDWDGWREGQLAFRESTFGKVAGKLEKWYGVTIAFENENVKDCPVTASFDKGENLKQVLHMLSILNNTRYEFIDDRHIIISGGGCTKQSTQ